MSYRSFTWNLTEPEARQVENLLQRYVIDGPAPFTFKVDRHTAALLIAKIEIFREVSPDGASPTSGPADA